MSVYLITYDLNRPGHSYEGLLQEIMKYDWARLSESSYVVDTEIRPKQLFEKLRPHIDDNDNLAVIHLTSPWWVKLPKDVVLWLKSRL